MKVSVDTNKCAMHGDCIITAPEVFDLGDTDDHVVVLRDEVVEPELIALVRLAADRCPTAALTVTD